MSPDGFGTGGGIGWYRVALVRILVKPMRDKASALFRATFAVAPRAAASAPGRVNLIGEHTDYNGGPVLPVALAARTSVAVGPAEAGVLEVVSARDGRLERVDYKEGRPAGWGAYIAGVMRELLASGAAPAGGGARVAVVGGVPVGAGRGPPAAVTVATRRVRGRGRSAAAGAAGARVALELAGGVAAAAQAGAARAGALAGAARRGRDGAHPLRGAAARPGSGQAVRPAAVRVARILPPPLRLQHAGAGSDRSGREAGRSARRAAHGGGLGRRRDRAGGGAA